MARQADLPGDACRLRRARGAACAAERAANTGHADAVHVDVSNGCVWEQHDSADNGGLCAVEPAVYTAAALYLTADSSDRYGAVGAASFSSRLPYIWNPQAFIDRLWAVMNRGLLCGGVYELFSQRLGARAGPSLRRCFLLPIESV